MYDIPLYLNQIQNKNSGFSITDMKITGQYTMICGTKDTVCIILATILLMENCDIRRFSGHQQKSKYRFRDGIIQITENILISFGNTPF